MKSDIKSKPWKIARSQKIVLIQRNQRVKSAKKLLKRFGMRLIRSYFKWKRLINIDFSKRIHLTQKHNNKNNVIWSRSKTEISIESQTISQAKYSPGIMLYDGISSHGLIPACSPTFVDEWLKSQCKNISKKLLTMNRVLSIKLIQQQLKLYIDILSNDINVIWQNDVDSKHHSCHALDKINELFQEYYIEPGE